MVECNEEVVPNEVVSVYLYLECGNLCSIFGCVRPTICLFTISHR